MKIIFYSIFICISIGILGFKGSDGIRFEHKRVKRMIAKELGDAHVRKEVQIPDSIYYKYFLNGKLFRIENDSLLGYAWIGRVNSCRSGGCDVSSDSTQMHGYEFFDYCLLFSADQEVINTKVFNYKATHGQEVSGRGWLKQFRGYQAGTPLRYGKEIDAIAGATISAENLTLNVKDVANMLREVGSLE